MRVRNKLILITLLLGLISTSMFTSYADDSKDRQSLPKKTLTKDIYKYDTGSRKYLTYINGGGYSQYSYLNTSGKYAFTPSSWMKASGLDVTMPTSSNGYTMQITNPYIKMSEDATILLNQAKRSEITSEQIKASLAKLGKTVSYINLEVPSKTSYKKILAKDIYKYDAGTGKYLTYINGKGYSQYLYLNASRKYAFTPSSWMKAAGLDVTMPSSANSYNMKISNPYIKKFNELVEEIQKYCNKKMEVIETSSLNIRSGPGTNYSILGSLKKGDIIDVQSISGGWAKFSFKGKIAYASDKYLRIVNSSKDKIFKYSEIPNQIKDKMSGNSLPQNVEIKFDDLSYIQITHYGFDKKSHVGEMVVRKEVAKEVVDIFKELYEKKYPIEKIRLIDEYNANDNISMKNNNSSAFCYRKIAGTNKLSNHGKGLAIDINPIQNPHVKETQVSPTEGREYTNRSNVRKGMIIKGDACYEAFTKRGWKWGGSWRNPDYQHFEKSI